MRGSNSPPHDYKSSALPTELTRRGPSGYRRRSNCDLSAAIDPADQLEVGDQAVREVGGQLVRLRAGDHRERLAGEQARGGQNVGGDLAGHDVAHETVGVTPPVGRVDVQQVAGAQRVHHHRSTGTNAAHTTRWAQFR